MLLIIYRSYKEFDFENQIKNHIYDDHMNLFYEKVNQLLEGCNIDKCIYFDDDKYDNYVKTIKQYKNKQYTVVNGILYHRGLKCVKLMEAFNIINYFTERMVIQKKDL